MDGGAAFSGDYIGVYRVYEHHGTLLASLSTSHESDVLAWHSGCYKCLQTVKGTLTAYNLSYQGAFGRTKPAHLNASTVISILNTSLDDKHK